MTSLVQSLTWFWLRIRLNIMILRSRIKHTPTSSQHLKEQKDMTQVRRLLTQRHQLTLKRMKKQMKMIRRVILLDPLKKLILKVRLMKTRLKNKRVNPSRAILRNCRRKNSETRSRLKDCGEVLMRE
ncbi:protein C' [Almpiwar virus]|uniref:Protein C n=1 Tax=Almpiwar virus TaxID=318843 RepID=A0A024A267_9RHAB|nr:protein C' [Almpiwar virus]AHY85665.1 protein C' [Almpiwar virus]